MYDPHDWNQLAETVNGLLNQLRSQLLTTESLKSLFSACWTGDLCVSSSLSFSLSLSLPLSLSLSLLPISQDAQWGQNNPQSPLVHLVPQSYYNESYSDLLPTD